MDFSQILLAAIEGGNVITVGIIALAIILQHFIGKRSAENDKKIINALANLEASDIKVNMRIDTIEKEIIEIKTKIGVYQNGQTDNYGM